MSHFLGFHCVSKYESSLLKHRQRLRPWFIPLSSVNLSNGTDIVNSMRTSIIIL
ncbi:MAG: hypothetical protein M0018_05180 [Nitrospiraceae bacterium]|nr:hypothetical protein [Nitrospiraceae bacterium]